MTTAQKGFSVLKRDFPRQYWRDIDDLVQQTHLATIEEMIEKIKLFIDLKYCVVGKRPDRETMIEEHLLLDFLDQLKREE